MSNEFLWQGRQCFMKCKQWQQKEYVFSEQCQEKSHFKNCDLTFFFYLWQNVTPSFQKEIKEIQLWIFQEEAVIHRTVHLANESLCFIMLLYIKHCVTLWMCVCVSISLLSGGWCVSQARCKSCQDVEGERPASGRAGSKAKGPSVIFNTSATSPSSGTMVTSQKFLPPCDTFLFNLPSVYSFIPISHALK